MKRRSPILLSVLSVLVAVFAAQTAFAVTMSYGTFFGTNVTFDAASSCPVGLGICDTSTTGDFLDTPVIVGNSLFFSPTEFKAESSVAGGGIDVAGSLLDAEITTNASFIIDSILIQEAGDATLTSFPPPGDMSTGAFASFSGVVTVLETLSGPITPVLINFKGTFTPPNIFDPDDLWLFLPGDPGTTTWSASTVIDVASVVPDATKVVLALDNDMTASNGAVENGNTSAKIQKKASNGLVITIIPEPGTLALLCGGLLGLAGLKRAGAK